MSLSSRCAYLAVLALFVLPASVRAAGEHERFSAQLSRGYLRSAQLVLTDWATHEGVREVQYHVDRADLARARADALRAAPDTGSMAAPTRQGPTAEQFDRERVDILGEAAALFPLRLDILLARAAALQELGDYVPMMTSLETACELGGEPIRWAFDVPFEVAQAEPFGEFLPTTLQAMMRNFTDWESEEGDALAEAIAGLAVIHFPDHPFGHNSLGVLLALRGDTVGAVAALQRAHELSPHDVMVLSNLSRCRHANGDSKGALKDLKRALAMTDDADTKAAFRVRIKGLKSSS